MHQVPMANHFVSPDEHSSFPGNILHRPGCSESNQGQQPVPAHKSIPVASHGEVQVKNMLTIKVMPATPGHSGVNPFTKAPCKFKAKRALITVTPSKELKRVMIHEASISVEACMKVVRGLESCEWARTRVP